MSKKFFEVSHKNAFQLHNRLKYWSNACGDLHYHGLFDISDVNMLPKELQRAYAELWEEGNGCYEYLAEFDGNYYIALVSEFTEDYATDCNLSMDELYEIGKANALKLYDKELFSNTILALGKHTGFQECHEIFFLVPAMEPKIVYDEIEKQIYENIYKI